ncbi:HlyD family secretion protein [Acidithiobacillus montserratensis]|uniref:HlyD family secretion protein n=1 Tax=Acidithiobacillus montserratensis TaxID=2729135 RepID=A0ACD5HIC3_9PROT|nr:HlyD family secretion protein [Acidithiobacillus montserratensis]MBN2680681.1 HlyD family secretion protein [Acidithiobacillaceae bacterium]MBU2746687.1 HlyD family secretion protein [Acidithiobacillus montserratensis]
MSTAQLVPDPEKRPLEKKRRRGLLGVAILLFLVSLIGIFWWFLRGQYWIETNDAYVNGNISPVDSLSAGTIQQVLTENTEYVHAGQILAILQGNHSRLSMEEAEAHLATTVRQVRQDFAKVRALQQDIQAKKAALRKLQMDFTRYQQSLPSGAVSVIRLENTRQEIAAASAAVAQAQAKLQGAEALVAGTTVYDNPLVQQAVAAYEQAEITWQRHLIRAPISGFIAQRSAYPGLKVKNGQRLFSVVPLNDLWVVANFKETVMRHIHPGQSVQLTSDYYGGSVHFHGTIMGLIPGAGSAFSILPPQNATGNYIHIVERVPVRIAIPRAELRKHPLRPGLSMIAEVHWQPGHAHSVLQPLTSTPKQEYETSIYQDEVHHAQERARSIIQKNL